LLRYKTLRRNVFQKTSDVVIGVWKCLVVTFITASWITVYQMSKKTIELTKLYNRRIHYAGLTFSLSEVPT
jgi:hypothetical protein